MVNDDTLSPGESIDEQRQGRGSDVERPADTYEEIRVELRANEPVSETPGPSEGERAFCASRQDPAATRCGRWGDERWR